MSIQPSLISSCVTRNAVTPDFDGAAGIKELFSRGMSGTQRARLPETPLDVYAFMEADAREWADWLEEQGSPLPNRQQDMSAVDFLAALNSEQVHKIATQMKYGLGSRAIKVVALASFIPEIARSERTRAHERAIDAISSLIQLSHHLKKKGGNPPVIEVVAGSKRESIAVEDQDISVELIDDIEGRRRVLNTLGKALLKASQQLGREDNRSQERVLKTRVAIELEPGPLFVLRDLQTLRQFAEEIRNSQDIFVRECVGFNLDIAHWRLAGIPPEVIDPRAGEVYCESIAKKIFHAHIAGHHAHGHFGDVPLLDLNSRSEYLPWLGNLSMLWGGDGSQAVAEAGFTGHVAVEFEAAKCDDFVIRSVQELANLLR